MEINVTLELDDHHHLTAEQIEKDIQMAESQIGWMYDYKIQKVEVVKGTYGRA